MIEYQNSVQIQTLEMTDENLTEKEALLLHNAIHNRELSSVTFRGKSLPIQLKPNTHLRFVRTGVGTEALEQNPQKLSKWARLAKAGHKITWFLHVSDNC
jgi:hypothetical protein